MARKTSIRQEMFKVCSRCHETKSIKSFNRDRYKQDGRCSACKSCYLVEYKAKYALMNLRTKKWQYRNVYGTTIEDVEAKWLAQGQRCLNPHCENRGKRCIDHKKGHKAVRGLLCDGCNKTLGHALDNPAALRWLADYLEAYNAKFRKSA